MEHNDELKSFPELSIRSHREPFEAPEGYFDQLSSHIQDRISKENKKTSPIFFLRPVTIVTCLVILLVVSGTYIYFNQKNTKTELAVTYDDILESEYYNEIDESTLCEAIPPISTTATNSVNKDDKSIDEYLITNADESLISNSL